MVYLLLAYEDEQQLGALPAEARRAIDQAWQASTAALRTSGYLLALAALSASSTAITLRFQDGEVSLIAGALAGPPERLTRLIFIDAVDLNAAIRVASRLPQVQGGPIEVRPVADFARRFFLQRPVIPKKEKNMNKATSAGGTTSSLQITQYISELAEWRGELLARLRKLILATDPGLVEAWKWDTPVWARNGNVLAVAAFQDHVKLNFFKGASLSDPHGLFNSGLEAKATRAIDIREGDEIDEAALTELIRAAVAHNLASSQKK